MRVRRAIPPVQGERVTRADLAAARPVKPLSFCLGICLFDISHQKIELLDGHADGGLNARAFFALILITCMVCWDKWEHLDLSVRF